MHICCDFFFNKMELFINDNQKYFQEKLRGEKPDPVEIFVDMFKNNYFKRKDFKENQNFVYFSNVIKDFLFKKETKDLYVGCDEKVFKIDTKNEDLFLYETIHRFFFDKDFTKFNESELKKDDLISKMMKYKQINLF